MELTSDVEGVGFEVEESGVVQVSGANPDGMMIFEIAGKVGAIGEPVTGIRLDVLTDKRLPANGPGRAPNGNFVLNEVELLRGVTKLAFGGAKANHSQANFEVSKLIDGNRDKMSGWAVAPQYTHGPYQNHQTFGQKYSKDSGAQLGGWTGFV